MQTAKLVKMANEIGQFFEADPDRAVALEGVASHLSRFWEPRMRKELLAHVDASGGEGLRPLVLEAVKAHRARLEPRQRS
jgi:formate dehydrogenase subunit delta